MAVISCWLMVVSSSLSLLIFCLLDLSVFDRGVLLYMFCYPDFRSI